MTNEYRKRIADRLLSDKLEAMGAVLIEGPKGCGKTTTAEQQAGSVIYMDDPENGAQYRRLNIMRPSRGRIFPVSMTYSATRSGRRGLCARIPVIRGLRPVFP